jgi:hypothetical protein
MRIVKIQLVSLSIVSTFIILLFVNNIFCANRKKEGQNAPCPGGNCCEAVYFNNQFSYNIYYCYLQWAHCEFSCQCVCEYPVEPAGYQIVIYNLYPVKRSYQACIEFRDWPFGNPICNGNSTEPSLEVCLQLFSLNEPWQSLSLQCCRL